jgi:hypothetical protein
MEEGVPRVGKDGTADGGQREAGGGPHEEQSSLDLRLLTTFG